ncbi:MAG: class I SAM-dependent methyltransferase, partial [Elusimicrobia bacterium]|nr:class I SAM-dependent methyltransferase [Elusimicrobiota bacterium]
MDKTKFQIIEKSTHSNKVAELYGRLAWIYNFFTDFEMSHHKKAVPLAEIKETDAVLEVACGTGRATVAIAKRIGRGGEFFAVDITKAMLNKAKNRLKKNGLLDRVQWQLGDAKKLQFPNNKFAFVYNAYMFDLIDASDFPDIISEFKRVLKPGGKLVLVNMSKNKKGKTFYEFLYEKGLLGFASGGCRPVVLKPFLKEAEFEKT